MQPEPILATSLSAPQVEALRRLGGTASVDAVRSLGQLLRTAAEASPTRGHLATRGMVDRVLNAAGQAFAVHFTVDGGARMRVLIHFTNEGAALMAGLLLGSPMLGLPPAHEESISASALAEACNILVSSYVSSIGQAVGLTLVPSIPHVAVGELSKATAAAFGDLQAALFLVTDLRLPGVRFAGRIIAASDDQGTAILLRHLGA